MKSRAENETKIYYNIAKKSGTLSDQLEQPNQVRNIDSFLLKLLISDVEQQSSNISYASLTSTGFSGIYVRF